ncbi:MAG: hypothetical protein H0W87_09140 [Actinobacteria bacterium]|nr:hypothetical protein [Actinomycetota bacterium]
MKPTATPQTYLPFGLGEPRSFGSLTVVPLYNEAEPGIEYVGLDEALAGGLTVTEVNEAVETLLVANPRGTAVLLYEGEELVGAKQNRILERSILVGPGVKRSIGTGRDRGSCSTRSASTPLQPTSASRSNFTGRRPAQPRSKPHSITSASHAV